MKGLKGGRDGEENEIGGVKAGCLTIADDDEAHAPKVCCC